MVEKEKGKGFGLELPVTRPKNETIDEVPSPSKERGKPLPSSLPPWVTKPPPPKETYRLGYAVFCCVLYVGLNFYLNFTNKYLFHTLDFQYPVLIILLGTSASCFGSGLMVFWEQEKLEWKVLISNFKLIIFLGMGHSLTSAFENLALSRVSLSLTQILKTIGPSILLFYRAWETSTPPKTKIVFLVIFQMIGASLSVYHNPELDFLGIVYSILSTLAACLSAISSEKMMKDSKMTPTQLTFFSSIPAIFILLSLMEGHELTRLRGFGDSGTGAILLVLSTAVVALFYSISQFMVVQACGALYYAAIGSFKTALLVGLAIIFLHEQLTWINSLGVIIGLCSFGAYSYEKFKNGVSATNDDV